jgi:hypothetical protein
MKTTLTGPSAGVEPAPCCLEDSRSSVGRRGQWRAGRESNSAPRCCRPRSSQRSGSVLERWRRIELLYRAWHARTLPLSYHRKSCLERVAGVEPALTAWGAVVLPLNEARAGANSGSRTRIGGLEDRGPAFGRCSHKFIQSCSRGLHSPSPAYQAGASLSRPEQHGWSRPESNRLPSGCKSGALPCELRPQDRRPRGELNPHHLIDNQAA